MNEPVVTGAEMREKLLRLQEIMLAMPKGERVECPVRHHFGPGVYGREIFLRAGTRIMGKIHKHAHINNISMGRVVVATEFGTEKFQAPYQFISQPGTKRVVWALTDTIWTTYHPNPTDTQDLDEIEAYVIAKDYEELGLIEETVCRGELLP